MRKVNERTRGIFAVPLNRPIYRHELFSTVFCEQDSASCRQLLYASVSGAVRAKLERLNILGAAPFIRLINTVHNRPVLESIDSVFI